MCLYEKVKPKEELNQNSEYILLSEKKYIIHNIFYNNIKYKILYNYRACKNCSAKIIPPLRNFIILPKSYKGVEDEEETVRS